MRFIAPLAILSVPAAASARGGITPENGHKVVADTLIQRCEKLLEEMKEEGPSGEGKTASTELQFKLARLYSDRHKFLYSSIKDEQVRGELSQRIHPSYEAVWRQFHDMGGDEKFPMMWPRYLLYDIVNDINYFAQMSQKDQAANMLWLRNLGRAYPAGVKEATGISGLDRADFAAAEQTLAQLQAQYPQSLN
jgi:hypothetical protein